MILEKLIIILIYYINYLNNSSANNDSVDTTIRYFPENFSFGVATTVYHMDDGWNADGQSPSIWDKLNHNESEIIADNINGDIPADSYKLFDQDLKALNELEVNFYRFSISWSHILPTGNLTSRNQYGINYYNSIINKLIENHIEPMITICYSELPDKLQQLGGFTDPMILQYVHTYADVLFKEFGDRVKTWITFNEPYSYCQYDYDKRVYSLDFKLAADTEYLCIDNIIKAHALVYKLYRTKYFYNFKGKIGIALNTKYYISDDEKLVDRILQMRFGIFAHPIFSNTGGYPDIITESVKRNKQKKGTQLPSTNLPLLNATWRNMIRGSADFLGLNYYTSRIVESNTPIGQSGHLDRESEIEIRIDKKWKCGEESDVYHVPEGLEKLLRYIRDNYNNIEVIITENGWSDVELLNDDMRIMYIKGHLQAVLNAIDDDCNVTGYTVWSLNDYFVFNRGYKERFGLYSVNLSTKTITAKKSAKYYNHIIRTRKLSGFSSSSKIHHQIEIIIFFICVTILNI